MSPEPLSAGQAARLLRSLAAGLEENQSLPRPSDLGLSPTELSAALKGAAELLAPSPASSRQEVNSTPGLTSAQLYCDGAARGNPGPAGAGAVLLDGQGQEIAIFTQYLGKATNNVAEYQALILGLQGAKDLGVSDLEVFLDSELLVRQLSGEYRVKSAHLKPLYNQALTLLRGMGRVNIRHVPREENRRADELANRAIDEA